MERIKAILIDDESNSRIVLRNLLENFGAEIDVVGEADNAEDGFTLINEKKPHLVFLDIQMPKENGFALLKRFDELPFEVVFVTSYDKYAINAIKFSALDYLLKPVVVNELKNTIEKATKRIKQKESDNVKVVNLLRNMESGEEQRKIAVHIGEVVRFIEEKNIVYIEADGAYCNVYTNDNQRYTTARNLKDFEDYFGIGSEFVRVHRSVFINTRHIKEYSKGEPCVIEMNNGKSFEVPRRKKPEVLARLR